MRKLLKLALVALGIRALLRWRRRRHEAAQPTAATPQPAPDPADELRQKLAESREEVTLEADEPTPAAVADRRAEVHEQGRATLDEMKSSDEG